MSLVNRGDKSEERPIWEKPKIVDEPHPVPVRYYIFSLELLLNALAMAACLYLLMFAAGSVTLYSINDIWLKGTAKLPSDSSKFPSITVDLLILPICGLVMCNFVATFARLLLKAQQLYDKERDSEANAIIADPVRRKEARKAESERIAAQDNLLSDNAQRRKEGKPILRLKVKKTRVMSESILTNVAVGLSIMMCLVTAAFVQLRRSNVVRGFGAIIMLVIPIGVFIFAQNESRMLSVLHYLGVLKAIFVLTILFAIATATVL